MDVGLGGYEYDCENEDNDKEESPKHKSNSLDDTDEDDIAPVVSDGSLKRLKKMTKSTPKVEKPQWDEEAGGENEFGEDGFLNSPESDSSDEVGVCEICNEVGDMIVCNGGIHHRGCDKLFHMHCIGLHLLPQGKFSQNLMNLN